MFGSGSKGGYRMPMRGTFHLLLLGLLTCAGCQSGRMSTVQGGKTTWRSVRFPVDRDGGVIEVRVTGDRSGDATVFLLEPGTLERMHDDLDVDPIAAAEGPLGPDGFVVRFTSIPPGEYVVGSFMDLDGDGTLIHAGSFFSPGYDEPHSDFLPIKVESQAEQTIDLVIKEERS